MVKADQFWAEYQLEGHIEAGALPSKDSGSRAKRVGISSFFA